MRTTQISKTIGWGTGAILALSLTTSSFADITAKKIGLGLDKSIVYSELSINHYLRSVNTEDGSIKQEPRLRFTPVVGMKILDEALDIRVTGFYDRMENTTVIEQTRQAELLLESKEWELAKIFSIQPYVEHKLSSLGKDSSTLLASIQKLSNTYETKFGTMTPSLSVELGTYVHGKAQESDYKIDSKVEDSDIAGLGLRRDDSGALKGIQKDQDFYHEWKASFSMVPAVMSDLTINLSTWLNNEYAPAYTVKSNAKEESRYVVAQSTKERVRLTYKINEQFSVRNDFTAYQSGAFEGRKEAGKDSYLNELGVIYQIL